MKGSRLMMLSVKERKKERKTAGEAGIKVKHWSLIKYRNKKKF